MQNNIQPVSSVSEMSTTHILNVVRDALSFAEESAKSLNERILPILLDTRLNESVGEDLCMSSQSSLNKELTDILVRIQELNGYLIQTRDQVTL